MGALLAAGAVFLGIHIFVSGTRLRDAIVGKIGEKPYLGVFALSSLAAIVWLCMAYNSASASSANTVLFLSPATIRDYLGLPVMFLAFALVVPGVTRGNPTSQGQEKARIDGVLRITRHPFLWGVTLWSGFHLLVNGTLAGVIFFGTFFLVATFGMRAIDGKVKRKRPQDFAHITAQTSAIPFAAIIEGKNRFFVAEYFDWRFLAAVLAFVGFLAGHIWLFSASPFPSFWP